MGLHADNKGRPVAAQGDASDTTGQRGGFELLKVQGLHGGVFQKKGLELQFNNFLFFKKLFEIKCPTHLICRADIQITRSLSS